MCIFLGGKKTQGSAEGEDDEGAGWDEDDDLDLDIELEEDQPGAEDGSSDVFIAPSLGVPQSQIWVNNSSLIADHVAAGSFDTAMNVGIFPILA